MTDGTLIVDLMRGEFYADDPHPAFTWMRRNRPVYHDEANDVWGIASYQDVRALSTDPSTFSSAGGIRPKFPATPMMVDSDPPHHTHRRKIVSAGFTPRRIAELTEHVRRVCDEVIDEVCERGSCDFVHDIAAPLPLAMIGDMLGVAKQDRADLLRWSDDMLRSQGDPDPAALDGAAMAFLGYSEYMQPVMAERRESGRTDDLIGILVNAEVDGERLGEDDLIYETLLILVGGDETTRHVLSGGMLALQEHPQQLAALAADPTRLPRAVEEMLRWVTPIQNMVRTTTREIRVGDVLLPEGAELMLLYPSANRDESVFDDAFRFDIDRNPNPHIAFGQGTHFCLGNQLARLELTVMFERLFARLPDLHLAGPGPFPRRQSNFVCGLERLPVEFTPTPRVG